MRLLGVSRPPLVAVGMLFPTHEIWSPHVTGPHSMQALSIDLKNRSLASVRRASVDSNSIQGVVAGVSEHLVALDTCSAGFAAQRSVSS